MANGRITLRSMSSVDNSHKTYIGSGWQWGTENTLDFNFTRHISALGGLLASQQRNYEYKKAAMWLGGGARYSWSAGQNSGDLYAIITAPDLLSFNKVQGNVIGLEMERHRQLLGKMGIYFGLEVAVDRAYPTYPPVGPRTTSESVSMGLGILIEYGPHRK